MMTNYHANSEAIPPAFPPSNVLLLERGADGKSSAMGTNYGF